MLKRSFAGIGARGEGYTDPALTEKAWAVCFDHASECSFVFMAFRTLLPTLKQRDEADAVAIQSGTEFGVTLGTPIGLRVQNKDHRPHDYTETDLYPRPSHADWTYLLKYGVKASSGGGRSSARETIGARESTLLCPEAFDAL